MEQEDYYYSFINCKKCNAENRIEVRFGISYLFSERCVGCGKVIR